MPPESVRTQDYLNGVRARARELNLKIRLKHSPEQLWPFLSNTDMVNADTLLPTVKIGTRPTGTGGSELSVESKDLGLPIRFEELPFEWLRPEYFGVDRLFTQGPVDYLRFETRLAAMPDGGSEVTIRILVTPKLPWIVLRPRVQQILNRMRAVYEKIDMRAGKQKPISVAAFLSDPAPQRARIEALTGKWQALAESPELARAIATYLYTAPDRYVNKLRPFELAALYELDPMATLRFCLKATKAGYLNLSWDLLCPGCQGAKAEAASLAEVNPNAHCDACDIDYSVSLDENFELTFHPVATVRSFYDAPFCAGSPSNTAHLAAQLYLWPGEHKVLKTCLSPGKYRLRSPSMQGYLDFEIGPDGLKNYDLILDQAFEPTATPLFLSPGCEIRISNRRGIMQTLKVEDLGWRAQRVSAALVSTLQDFRDSFSVEVLKPGIQLAVSNLTVMFTDLKDSTMMYELRGDASAFSLVQEHFEIMHELIAKAQGAIVKTIGDAVMAVFQDPVRAMGCALEIQRHFRERNARRPEHPIIVKLGLHRGPSIALNLNDRLDYFGSTINKAARIQSESVGEDIVISPDMLEAEGIQELLAGHPLAAFDRNLKGLAGTARLYRIEPVPAPASGLELAAANQDKLKS